MTTTHNSSDHDLREAIERELNWACDVGNDRVGIAATDGAITLSGEVLSYPEKAAAVRAALRVRGVIAFADEIVVRHAFGRIDDAEIARSAAAALSNTTLVPADRVGAAVHDHAVTLTGTVSRQHQRAAAEHIVGALSGVVAVHNLIEVKPPEQMPATADARANVHAALMRNAELEAEQIEVTISGTEIRLTGRTSTWAAKHQAEYAAWCTPGVSHVNNQLVIDN